MAENPGAFGADLDQRLTVRMPVKAGSQTISATTILKSHAMRDDLIKPFMRTTIDGLDITGDPSVDRLTIEGPFNQTGSGDTASRRKIFICRPASAADEQAVRDEDPRRSLARLAYRRPLDHAAIETLMNFYQRRRNEKAASTPESNRRSSLSWRVRNSCSASSPTPPTSPPTRVIVWTTWRWLRVCRFSCGAAFRTTRC